MSSETKSLEVLQPDSVFTMTQCSDCMLGFNEEGRVVPGSGYTKATLMVVGERPYYGKPFCGQKDKILRKSINSIMGIADDRLFFTTMIKCNTDEEKEIDRKLYKAAVLACSKHLNRQIELIESYFNFFSRASSGFKSTGASSENYYEILNE